MRFSNQRVAPDALLAERDNDVALGRNCEDTTRSQGGECERTATQSPMQIMGIARRRVPLF